MKFEAELAVEAASVIVAFPIGPFSCVAAMTEGASGAFLP
jgi:hypothetical protein